MPLPNKPSKRERLSAKLPWYRPKSWSATPTPEKNRCKKFEDDKMATRSNSPGPRQDVSPASQSALQADDPCHEPLMTESLVSISPPAEDLWERAFRQLSDDARQRLIALGFHEQTQVTNEHRVKELIGVVHEKEDTCKQKKWKMNFAGHEIIIGDYAIKAATWLQKLGDIVIPFAPPQASAPWGLVKNILQVWSSTESDLKTF